MAMRPSRVRSRLQVNKGRIILVEQQLTRLEKRVETLEKQNAALKAGASKRGAGAVATSPRLAQLEKQNASLKTALTKLRARVDQSEKDQRTTRQAIARLTGLSEPIQALVRSFKQTPGAPFDAWRVWMLSALRKRGVYRKQIFK